MNSQIDFRTLPMCVPSICIPRVFSNVDEKRIRRVLDELKLGDIKCVDIISSKSIEKGPKFNRVVVHFTKWNANENANAARERLINGKDIKIIYDEPWFWKVSAYREPSNNRPPHHKSAKPAAKKVSIQFDDDDVSSIPSRTQFSSNPQPHHSSSGPVKRQVPRSQESSPPRRREPATHFLKKDNEPVVKKEEKEPFVKKDKEPVVKKDKEPFVKKDKEPVVKKDKEPFVKKEQENETVQSLDYGVLPVPPKRRIIIPKLKIEQPAKKEEVRILEDGEVDEKVTPTFEE